MKGKYEGTERDCTAELHTTEEDKLVDSLP